MKHIVPIIILVVAFCLPAVHAEEVDSFVRITRDGKAKPVSFDTAIAKYTNRAGKEVDLVGAVHIGEKEYYQKLNDLFRSYDAVLFELVIQSEGDVELIAIQKDSDREVSSVQKSLADMLGLSFQLNEIDYSAANMVHADMTMDQLKESMVRRDENVLSLLGKVMQVQNQGAPVSLKDLTMLALPSTRTLAMKRMMALQFESMEDFLASINGNGGIALLHDRNNSALKVLTSELKSKNKIAIFYGAAHLQDMAEKLKKSGYTPHSTTWLQAWNLGK